MEREITEVYCGNGKGKTTLAVGRGLRFATQGKSVIIIQFLKGNERRELDFLEELDELDFARQYNSIFGSKYLYIKNADTKNHVIVDADSKEHDIAPDEIQVWYTGKLVCADVSKLTLSESETAAVRL